MIDNVNENWISITEAAEHLGVTKDSIRKWIKKTDIPAHKIGKLWKFKKIRVGRVGKKRKERYRLICVLVFISYR